MKCFQYLLLLASLLSSCGTSEKTASKSLRISSSDDAQSLDPRQVRGLEMVTLMHLFFEGLMRYNQEGKLSPALAEKVDVSPNLITYTFTLRPSQWSNGDPVTAQDFVDTWISLLDPTFPAPNAYQLYVIRGAKAAKEGRGSLQAIGLHAKDERTLVVELESPTPYFLELTTSHFYFPVHPSWRQSLSHSAAANPSLWISNGPMVLESWKRHHELTAVPNLNYWDKDAVRLKHITVMQIEENTALRMFENGELEWVGSPLSAIPTDAIPSLKKAGTLKTQSGAGTHWFRLNTQRPPFDQLKMRRAFALALNRKALVDYVSQGDQQPALGIVPLSLGLNHLPYIEDNDLKTAQQYFRTSLMEMGMTADKLPTITLSYSQNERNHKIAQAVQQQWNQAFGIQVELQGGETKFITDKVKRADYQIALGSWFADFADPINFLEVFKKKSNPTNQTGWENAEYIQLLNQSSVIADPEKRWDILSQAEKLIMNEIPVIPLYYSTFIYAVSPRVKGVYFSDLGFIDFKYAELQ